MGASGKVVGLDLNPGMLVVARALPPPSEAPIEWQEGNAGALPFAEASFDVVLCQQGVQFFPDRPAALREMRRVLVPGGRLALSVWRSNHYHPFFMALIDALARHVSPEAGAAARAPLALGDGTELRALIAGAGFQEVRLRIGILPMRIASLEEYLPAQLAAMPMASAVAAAGEGAHMALLRDISAAVQAYRDDEGLVFPMEAHIAVARA
jgi:SAM-dependent methyltransferase